MIKVWDKYGVWITVYVLLVYYTRPFGLDYDYRYALFLNLFLAFNLTLTMAAFYRLFTCRWVWFGIWGPLLTRWIARWTYYTIIGLLFGGLVFSVFGLILAPVVAVLATIFHIVEDVQAQPSASPP